jgi:hypothetical protein
VGTAGQRERVGAGGGGRTALTALAHGQREREGALARQTDRRGPPVSAGGRGRAQAGPTWANWARMAFSISREFLFAFLFIFSRVFNSNSNQVSNSNQIKFMQQFKEYLDSI